MKTFTYLMIFVIVVFGISEILCMYMSDIIAYIAGFNITTILTLITINKMERKLAMEWWNNLSYQDKQKILDKYNMIGKPEHLTGREIEEIMEKEIQDEKQSILNMDTEINYDRVNDRPL